jgi:hypothetical protein
LQHPKDMSGDFQHVSIHATHLDSPQQRKPDRRNCNCTGGRTGGGKARLAIAVSISDCQQVRQATSQGEMSGIELIRTSLRASYVGSPCEI